MKIPVLANISKVEDDTAGGAYPDPQHHLAKLARFRTVDDPTLPPREPLNEKARAYLNRYLTLNPPQP